MVWTQRTYDRGKERERDARERERERGLILCYVMAQDGCQLVWQPTRWPKAVLSTHTCKRKREEERGRHDKKLMGNIHSPFFCCSSTCFGQQVNLSEIISGAL